MAPPETTLYNVRIYCIHEVWEEQFKNINFSFFLSWAILSLRSPQLPISSLVAAQPTGFDNTRIKLHCLECIDPWPKVLLGLLKSLSGMTDLVFPELRAKCQKSCLCLLHHNDVWVCLWFQGLLGGRRDPISLDLRIVQDPKISFVCALHMLCFFKNWRFAVSLHQAILPEPVFQYHSLTLCLCVTF